MARFSQKAIRAKADEWAAIRGKIRAAEAAKDEALAPLVEKHAKEMAAASKKHDGPIAKLQESADAIEQEIKGWLMTRDAPMRIESEKAVAEFRISSKLGPRVISVKQFLEAAKSKGEAMYECINVLVAKAEELLGKKEVDAISVRPESKSIEATLKLKD